MPKHTYAYVNEEGHICLPTKEMEALGIKPGDKLPLKTLEQGISIRPSISTLRRVYIEVTNKCNLNCATCMRNVWDVQYGRMKDETFQRIIAGFQTATPKLEIFFGGYGEPLSHPRIMDWVAKAKQNGHRVSLITNGILLTPGMIRSLIDVELDMIWVSLDGATPECYTDVRLGDSLPQILDNLKELQQEKLLRFGDSIWAGHPKLGIAFVAMQRNIRDLRTVLDLGTRLGATEFSVSNVLAHNPELHREELYDRTAYVFGNRYNQPSAPLVHLPVMDVDKNTSGTLLAVLNSGYRLNFFGGQLSQESDQCPFVERGSMAVRWDGKVSPCLPLMYTHQYHIIDSVRTSHEFFVGDLAQTAPLEIWDDNTFLDLRKRLQEFDFSPCTYCSICDLAEENLEDCFGNTQPTCGGCLWAQGLIRCP